MTLYIDEQSETAAGPAVYVEGAGRAMTASSLPTSTMGEEERDYVTQTTGICCLA